MSLSSNKKNFSKLLRVYIVVWLLVFIAFNIASVILINYLFSNGKAYGTPPWVGVGFIDVMFLLHLACGFYACKADSLQKGFYGLSVVYTSYVMLIGMFAVGLMLVVRPDIPAPVGVVIAIVCLLVMVIFVIKATVSAEIIGNKDDSLKVQMDFIRKMTSKIQILEQRAESACDKTICCKMYEILRYSDPMSISAVSQIENNIAVKFQEISEIIMNPEHSEKEIEEAYKEFEITVKERNESIKRMK